MADDKKDEELSEDDLDNVSGGRGATLDPKKIGGIKPAGDLGSASAEETGGARCGMAFQCDA
ncbi:bacteriocin [Magnetovibrio sp. PR-2]|uniref:bacteriocin n=1 Tax=Magnetovibrio sp. PR-2 TaxID=3120356 RepID=UPI002FCE287B